MGSARVPTCFTHAANHPKTEIHCAADGQQPPLWVRRGGKPFKRLCLRRTAHPFDLMWLLRLPGQLPHGFHQQMSQQTDFPCHDIFVHTASHRTINCPHPSQPLDTGVCLCALLHIPALTLAVRVILIAVRMLVPGHGCKLKQDESNQKVLCLWSSQCLSLVYCLDFTVHSSHFSLLQH